MARYLKGKPGGTDAPGVRRGERMEWRGILFAEASRARWIAFRATSTRPLDAETLVSGTWVRPLTISSGPLPVRRVNAHQPGSRRGGHNIVQHAVPSYPPSILSTFQEEEGREWEEAMVRWQAPARAPAGRP